MRNFVAPIAACLIGAQVNAAQLTEFEGTWSGVLTTADHEFWRVEDHLCFFSCTPEAYAHVAKVLEYDTRPLEALFGDVLLFMRGQLAEILTPEGLAVQQANTPANDPSLRCEPYGFVRQALSPLPMRIHRENDMLILEYEEWTQRRLVYLDGRPRPPNAKPAPLGHSIGREQNGTLVIETIGVTPDIYFSSSSGGGYSAELRGVERYTLHDNPRRLVLELTLEDPVMLHVPYRLTRTWLATPDIDLLQDSCSDVPGRP